MGAKYFKDLIVWQKSMDLVAEVYKLVRLLPNEELYVLSSQMRRSAISIPSNIAEGQKRRTDKEFATFLSYAKGSNAELQTQIMLCSRLGFLNVDRINNVLDLTVEIDKMLESFILKLN